MFSGVGWRFWAGLARPSCGSHPDNTPGLSACRHRYGQAQLRPLTPLSYATYPTPPSNRTVYTQGYVLPLYFFFYLRPLVTFLIHLLLSVLTFAHTTISSRLWVWSRHTLHKINPYPITFPYGNGMVLHFYQQQESSTAKTVHKVINMGLTTYV